MKNIALCFCVRNCGIYLPKIFNNIENLKKELKKNFNVYSVFVYDNCSDNSEKLLEKYKNNSNNVIIRNKENNSEMRTVRIAKARNTLLEIIYNELINIEFHIMIDADDINIFQWDYSLINKYLNNFDNDDWDSISFNCTNYYDIWPLLFDNFRFQVFGFNKNSDKVLLLMLKSILLKLENSKTNSIEVMSAFNGFAIYKTNRFKKFRYDGTYKGYVKLLNKKDIESTIKFLKKTYDLKVHGVDVLLDENSSQCKIKENKECTEHLYYHLSALKEGRKIKISKFCIRNLPFKQNNFLSFNNNEKKMEKYFDNLSVLDLEME